MRSDVERTPDEPAKPSTGRLLLATAWILLLGGRWCLAPVLLASHLVSAAELLKLDDGVLLLAYLALLLATVILLSVGWLQSRDRPKEHTSRAHD